MEENYENFYNDMRELTKRLGITLVLHNRPCPRSRKHMIRFTMKRRWGGIKKYAYECTADNLMDSVTKIEGSGGKIIAID